MSGLNTPKPEEKEIPYDGAVIEAAKELYTAIRDMPGGDPGSKALVNNTTVQGRLYSSGHKELSVDGKKIVFDKDGNVQKNDFFDQDKALLIELLEKIKSES